MARATILGVACVALLALLAVAAGVLVFDRDDAQPAAGPSPVPPPQGPSVETYPASESPAGFLYGRVTTTEGGTFEGRLRFAGDEEAFWGDYFLGAKRENPWAAHVPPGRLPRVRRPIELLGVKLGSRERPIDLDRPFMAQLGEIARVEAHGRDVRVILKSGTVVDLDRLEASDFDDGLRVWDRTRGVVDLESLWIRTIELLPTPPLGEAPYRLYGTVQTGQGDFNGFIRWDQEEGVGSDELNGKAAEGPVGLPFDTIRSVARRSGDSALVTLLDGRELVLSDSAEVGEHNRGIAVDDPRFGRVRVSWDAFERVDFSASGSGPGYDDFPPGSPLAGSVRTRSGDRFSGRLVYDLDENETTDTLDAQSGGVHFTVQFGLIAAIVPFDPEAGATEQVRVMLHGGEKLQLGRTGDLGESHAGMLIFVEGRETPEYVLWSEVERIDFDRPPGRGGAAF